MTPETIKAAKKAAQEFIRRADEAIKEAQEEHGWIIGTKTSGSLRRQSMELTRALSAMRAP